MPQVTIAQAGPDHARAIAALASTIWWRHYRSILSDAQIAHMLDMMYADEALQDQFAAGDAFFIARAGDRLVGFISCRNRDHTYDSAFIPKLYVDPDVHGHGIGRRLMIAAFDHLGADEVRLRVNRRNLGAINFYFRMGFLIERCIDELLDGRFTLDDYLMVRRGT